LKALTDEEMAKKELKRVSKRGANYKFAGGLLYRITKYQLPNGLIKVRRRWGQRHPQGANSGCLPAKRGLVPLLPYAAVHRDFSVVAAT
jgi:hypothetical protein